MLPHGLPPPRPLQGRRRGAHGFTAVEVLMAMSMMFIGAAAVMSMQKASVQGNFDSRQTDIANNIARTWVERLERDSLQWTCPGPACLSTSNMANAQLLNGAVTGQWFLPIVYMGKTPESMSPGFDILGRDLPISQLIPSTSTGSPGAEFCVNVRLSWLVPPTLPTEPGLIRADVRVLWPRGIVGGAPAAGFCTAATAALTDPESSAPAAQHPFFHTIYMTTTLKESPAQ